MLTGELVRLRPFEPEDADTVKRWQDDEELKAWAEHDAAKRLYEKIGFREVGRQRDVVFARGEWHDHIVMDLLHHELEA